MSGAASPTRRDAQRERTRQELLDAARTSFATHGYAGASVDAIAEAAGYTKGAVYANFRSKEELFLALLDREVDRTVELLATVLDQVAPRDRAGVLAEQASQLRVLDRDWFLLEAEFLLYAARSDDPRVRGRVAARQQRTRARITELVQRHLDEVGAEADVAAEDVARLLMATADGLTQAALVDETARDGDRVFGLQIALLLSALEPRAEDG